MAAPDVGLQLLDPGHHLAGDGEQAVRRVGAGVPGDVGEQRHLPVREPREAAPPRADQALLAVLAEHAQPDQVAGQRQRTHVSIGDGGHLLGHLREAEQVPQLVGLIERHPGPGGDLGLGEVRHRADQVLLERAEDAVGGRRTRGIGRQVG